MKSIGFAAALLVAALRLPAIHAQDAIPISEQIMVDQIGFRPASLKVAIFASPQAGQNAGTKYSPPAKTTVRRADNNADVLIVDLKAWNEGKTEDVSGDKVWYADISALHDAGTYYLYDAENRVRSYSFRIDKDVYLPVLKAAVRMYFYQRCGGDVPEKNAGTWNHPACHCAEGQDKAAQLYVDGQAKGQPRDVHGGWHDAGDYNKYVPFTMDVIIPLLMAYEFNPTVFTDDWNIPESGNGIPDLLDEVKWECDWLLRMQLPDGSACNRVTETTSKAGVSPDQDNKHPRYYTQPTTWATATLAADLACFSRVIAKFPSQAEYARKCRTAAEKAWAWLEQHPEMLPGDGKDHGRPSEAADAQCDNGKDGDFERRLMAALQLWLLDPQPKYADVFKKFHKEKLAPSLVEYALSPKADPAFAGEIRAAVKKSADERVSQMKSQTDAYRAWLSGYWWGCNQSKAELGYRAIFAAKLGVDKSSDGAYYAAAEEYLHYFHGRNPLCLMYLTNMGAKGAKLGVGKSCMSPFHTWFIQKSPWDGPDSLGPAPGYLVGGPNSHDAPQWLVPPAQQPPEKAFKDWNIGWNAEHKENENSWSFTEPAIYYQAKYILLLSQFVGEAK